MLTFSTRPLRTGSTARTVQLFGTSARLLSCHAHDGAQRDIVFDCPGQCITDTSVLDSHDETRSQTTTDWIACTVLKRHKLIGHHAALNRQNEDAGEA